MHENKQAIQSFSCKYYPFKIKKKKAKAISAKLLELNLKNQLEETGKKQYGTGRNGKKLKNWKKKTPKTRRNWMILKEKGRNRKKQEETGRNRKRQSKLS